VISLSAVAWLSPDAWPDALPSPVDSVCTSDSLELSVEDRVLIVVGG
jgi:hypothetical protein